MRSIAAPVIFLAMSAALAPAFAQSPRGAADNNSAMTGRLERLEEQMANLQGVVAAVETLAKNEWRRRRILSVYKRRCKLGTDPPIIRADCGTDPAPAEA